MINFLTQNLSADYYLTLNGRIVSQDNKDVDFSQTRIHSRLVGGKGGFGSMLRAIGARIEKTTNHEACRDLNGRRMRDVNNEKKYIFKFFLAFLFFLFLRIVKNILICDTSIVSIVNFTNIYLYFP